MDAALHLPHAEPGQRIGLFGGSFNPAHEGHRLVALQCLARLRLDAVWVMVTPGNPLKDHSELAPLARRLDQTRAVMSDPRLKVTGFEAAAGFHYTFETVRYLTRTRDDLNFVWLMGSDSLMNFHHWQHWQEIARQVPLAVYARPGSTLRALAAPVAQALAEARHKDRDAALLPGRTPPAWVFLRGVMSTASSTAIRKSKAVAPA